MVRSDCPVVPCSARRDAIAALLPVSVMATVVFLTGPLTYHLSTAKTLGFSAALLVASAGLLALVVAAGQRIVISPPLVGTWLGYSAISLIPLLWSTRVYDPGSALALSLATAVFLVVVPSAASSSRRLVLVASLVCAVMLVLGALCGLELAGLWRPFGKGVDAPERLVGTFGNPLYLAGYVVPALFLSAGLAVVTPLLPGSRRRRCWLTAVAAAAAATALACIALIYAKTAYVATGAGLVLFIVGSLAVSGRGKAARLVAILVALAAVAAAALASMGSLDSLLALRQRLRIPGFSVGELLYSRLPPWRVALAMWRGGGALSMLFGDGPGSYFAREFTTYQADYRLYLDKRGFQYAHNEYLQLLAEGGIVSLLAWLAVVAVAVCLLVRVAARAGASRPHRLAAVAVLAGIASTLVFSAGAPGVRNPGMQAVFCLYLGLAVAVERDVRRVARGPAPARVTPWSALIAGPFRPLAILGIGATLLLPLVYPLVHGYGRYRSDRALLLATAAQAKGAAATEVREGLAESLRWNPRNVLALYQDLLLLSPTDPPAAVRAAENVEDVIPGFLDTARLAGIARAETGAYEEAVALFRRQIGYDAVEPSSYVHLAACELQLGQAGEATRALKQLLAWTHRASQADRWHYNGVPRSTLQFSATSGVSRLLPASGGRLAVLEIGDGALAEVARRASERLAAGYDRVMLELYVGVARLFDAAAFGDVCLDFYTVAVQGGERHGEVADRFEALNRQGYESVRRELGSGASRRGTDTRRLLGLAEKYVTNVRLVRADEALRRDLAELESRYEGRR